MWRGEEGLLGAERLLHSFANMTVAMGGYTKEYLLLLPLRRSKGGNENNARNVPLHYLQRYSDEGGWRRMPETNRLFDGFNDVPLEGSFLEDSLG